MAKVNDEDGFTQLTKLNVTDTLLVEGDPIASVDADIEDGQAVKWDDTESAFVYAGATVDSDTNEWTFDAKANFPQGSIGIGEVMELSEGGTNVVVGDTLNNSMAFSVNSFFDDTTGTSNPTWTAFGAPFVLNIQTDDTQNLTDNPLVYSLTSTVVSPDQRLIDKITFRANGAMTNVSAEFVDNATGKVVKYLPNKAAFDGNEEGLTLIAGDNLFNLASQGTDSPGNYFLGFTPIILTDGQQLDITIKGDNIDLLGDLSGVPYQVAEAHDGQPQTVGTGTGDVVGPASAVDGGLAVYDGTTGTMLKSGSLITATTGGTNSNLIFTTSEAIGSGFFGLEFQDSGSNFRGNITFDEADDEISIGSDSGISLDADTDLYITATNVLEIQSNSGSVEMSAATTSTINSQDDMTVESTTASTTIGASTTIDLTAAGKITVESTGSDVEIDATSGNIVIDGQTIVLQTDVSGNSPVGFGNSADTLFNQVFLTTSDPEGVITASPGSLAIRTDSVTPANTGLYQLHATSTTNTPWVLIGSASTGGDVDGPGTSVTDSSMVLWDGTSGTQIKEEANITAASTGITFGNSGVDQKITFPDAVLGYDQASASTILGTNNDLLFQIINGDWNTTSQQGIEMLASTTLNLDCTAGNTILAADTTMAITGDSVGVTADTTLNLNSTGQMTLDASSSQVQIDSEVFVDGNDIIMEVGASSQQSIVFDGAGAVPHAAIVHDDSEGDLEVNNDVGSLSLNTTSANISLNSVTNVLANVGTEFRVQTSGGDTQDTMRLTNTGANGGESFIYTGDRDPVGNVTGTPGDFYVREDGTSSNLYQHQGASSDNTSWVAIASSSGDVSGPGSSTDNALALWDGTGGDTLSDSTLTYDGTTLNFPVGTNINADVTFGVTAGSILSLQSTSNEVDISGASGVAIGNSASGDTIQSLRIQSVGANQGASRFHVGDQDPSGVILGFPGDMYFRENGTSSNLYQNHSAGPGASTSGWVAIAQGSGDVIGPASSVDTEIAIFDGTTGKAIEGTTNITAVPGQNNAKLDLNTTNNADNPEIWFNGATSDQEGWIYLDASTDTFNVRGANSAEYSGGTKLDLYSDAGDVDIESQSAQVFITASTNAQISAGSGNTTVLANSGNVQLGATQIIALTNSDMYVNSSASETTGYAMRIEQSVTNGGKADFIAGGRNPIGNVVSTPLKLYFEENVNSFASEVYIGDNYTANDWVAIKGRGPALQFGNSGVNSSTTDRFMTPGVDFNDGASTTESDQQIPATRQGHLKNFRVRQNDPNGNGNDIVYTVRVNGADTSLSVTLASTGSEASQNNTRVLVGAGDLISIGVTKASGVNNTPNNVIAQVDFF